MGKQAADILAPSPAVSAPADAIFTANLSIPKAAAIELLVVINWAISKLLNPFTRVGIAKDNVVIVVSNWSPKLRSSSDHVLNKLNKEVKEKATCEIPCAKLI